MKRYLLAILALTLVLPLHASPMDIVPSTIPGADPRTIRETVAEIGNLAGLPEGLAEAVVAEESSWNPRAVSSGGLSRGLMQINRRYEGYLVSRYYTGPAELFDIWSPTCNAEVGCRYLADLYRRFGSWRLALCAYNYGCGRVTKADRYSAIPVSVRGYAERIIHRWEPISQTTANKRGCQIGGGIWTINPTTAVLDVSM